MPFTLRSECQEQHLAIRTPEPKFMLDPIVITLLSHRVHRQNTKQTKQESISQCMEPWKQSHCGNILQKEHAYKIYQIGL